MDNFLLIDPAAIREAYLKAFEGIDDGLFNTYAESDELIDNVQIEDRKPGTAITSKIWNDTINELRNICRALAVSIRAHKEGIDAVLTKFTEDVNALLQQLIDTDQAAFVEWLARAAFVVTFEEPDENTCRICFSFVNGAEVVTVKSQNLKSNQIFWMTTDDPATSEDEPVDDEDNPIWRIHLDASSEAIGNTVVTEESLEEHGFVTGADVAGTYATKAQVGTKTTLELEATSTWGGIEEVYSKIGSKPIGSSIVSTDVWGALQETYARTMSVDTINILTDLAPHAEDLLGMADRLTNVESDVGSLSTSTTTAINSLNTGLSTNSSKTNNNCTNLRNSIIELLALNRASYCTRVYNGVHYTKSVAHFYRVNKSAANWVIEDFTPSPLPTFNTTDSHYQNKTNSFTVELRSGWATIRINVYLRLDNPDVVNGTFVVPILTLPKYLQPNVSSFDYPLLATVAGGYTAEFLIITDSNSIYNTPTRRNVKFSDYTLVLYRLWDKNNNYAALNLSFPLLKSTLTYPLKYWCPTTGAAGGVSNTITLSAPNIQTI